MSENGRSRRNGGFDEDSAQIHEHQKKQDEEAQLEKIWEELENSEEGIEIDPEKFLQDMAILDDLIPLPDFDLSASWQEFKETHHNLLEGLDSADQQSSAFASEEERPKRKRSMKPIRVALVMVMILAMLLMASCGIIEYIIKAIGDWTEDTFGYRLFQELRIENPKPVHTDLEYYNSLEEALEAYNLTSECVPIRWPEGYVFSRVFVRDRHDSIKIVASYICGEKEILLTIWHYKDSTALELQAAEKLPQDAEVYVRNGIKHYILENIETVTISWIAGNELYRIAGEFSAEEVELMIDSIYEGFDSNES